MQRKPSEADTTCTLADSEITEPLEDQALLQKSAQIDEMIQRQVSIFHFILTIHFHHRLTLAMQCAAHSSPRDNIFSFRVYDDADEEEVASASIKLGPILDEIKVMLREILQLLNQDISLLVQDAKGIRSKLLHLKRQQQTEVEATIYPAAYIEIHQVKVLQAKHRISERAS